MFTVRQIAIHEAGHRVALDRFNINAGIISILDDSESLVSVEKLEEKWGERGARDHVLVCLAGYAAVIAAGIDEKKAAEFTGDWEGTDFYQAAELIKQWQLGSLEEWKAKAVAFMREPDNIKAVAIVAEHLLQRRILDSDYVTVLISCSDDGMPDGEWDQYLAYRGMKP